MIRYTVRVSPSVTEKIAEYGIYIAEQSGSPEIAERWVDRVCAFLARLNHNPRRFALAEEDQHRDYEIRRQIIGSYLALYSVNDAKQAVYVIGFRHASRLPRPSELPNNPSVM